MIGTDPLTHPDERNLRALNVLEHVASASQPVTLSQLCQRLDIPKATLSRLAAALQAHGYLMCLPGSQGYLPGPRMEKLGLAAVGNNSFRRACRVVLRGLVNELGETCNLSALDSDRVMYVERVETSHPLRMHMEPGSRLPLHCTAGGKLFLASMPVAEQQQLLVHMPLERMTPQTLTSAQTLLPALAEIHRNNIGIDNEEFVQGMVGVAAPIIGNDGRVQAAIVCHAASARASLNDLLKFLPQLRKAAVQMREIIYP
ncbi:IclR family transcriptional regulator [Pseudomonas putida]